MKRKQSKWVSVKNLKKLKAFLKKEKCTPPKSKT